MDFDNCSEITKKKIISVEENARKLALINENERFVRKIKVDNCLIKGEQERCDYLFEIEENCTLVIYVELKGKNIEKAYSQLMATIQLLLNKHQNCKKYCCIISSRTPPQIRTTLQAMRVQMLKKYGAKLLTKNSPANLVIQNHDCKFED